MLRPFSLFVLNYEAGDSINEWQLNFASSGEIGMTQIDVSNTTHPVTDYADAVGRIEALQQRDSAETLPVARTQFMAQGRKAENTVVMLHSLSNSPEQFYELGKHFFEHGYNVLIPRMPHHGSSERMTQDQAKLTQNELIAYLTEAIDIAQGLGKRVVAIGQSLGGVLAAMGAQYRRDVDLAVLINPTFGLWGLPLSLSLRMAQMMLALPNQFLWWDWLKAGRFGPDYIYPRVSTHALAEGLNLAHTLYRSAEQSKPAAKSILVVTHRRDPLATASATARLVALWKQREAEIRAFEFTDLPRLHDIVDPWSIGAHLDTTHGMLIQLIMTGIV